jgi:hypothetical protein
MALASLMRKKDLKGLKEPTLYGQTLQLTTENGMIDMVGTAEQCNEQGLQGFLDL